MQTATKVVLVGSFMCSFTILEFSFIFYILPKMESKVLSSSSLLPKIEPMPCMRLLNFSLRVSNLLNPFSRMLGKLRKRNVWPVGAVSNMITSKSIFSIDLNHLSLTR